jgi:O-antigen biosynthesis protein
MNEIMPLSMTLADSAVDLGSTAGRETMAASPTRSVALFVLGMHRSGTSAVGGMLSRLGVDLGTRLMPPTQDNPKGYFEHQDIVAVHDGLLASLGLKWDGVRRLPAGWQDGPAAHVARTALREIVARDFAGVPLWGLKDPRLCRLMPLWRPLLQETAVDARYLLVLRRPAEVVASLGARDGITASRAKLLWLRHVLEAESTSRGSPRAILHYRNLIEDADSWSRLVVELGQNLGITWPVPLMEAKPAIEELLTPELWHHRKTELDLALPESPDWIEMVESAFAGGDGPRLHEVCDRVLGEVDRADELMGEMVVELERSFIALARARIPAAVPPAAPPAPKVAVAPPAARSETVTEPEYAKWMAARATTAFARAEWVAERIAQWHSQPKFVLGMVLPAGTEGRLEPTLRSLQAQTMGDWELHAVIAGDPPLGLEGESRLIRHPAEGQPIETLNRILGDSAGDWVGLIDGGDQLAKHTLFELNLSIERHPEWFAFYTDEDRIDLAGIRFGPQFKPDFNLDLLRSMPYVGGLLLVRRAVFQELGGFSPRWDGLEECDLALRLAEHGETRGLGHIADVLYHRFTQSGRSNRPVQAICADLPKLVQAHLDRLEVKATAEPGVRPLFCRVRYDHDGPGPLVSIVIPTKNQLPLLKRCVETVLRITSYENYEIVIVDNGSTSQDAIEYLGLIEEKAADIGSRLRVLRHPGPFNFSAMNNRAVREARGDYICLLNNDTAPLDGDWLTEIMRHARRHEVGVVGAKLFYPDGRVQHGGVILGIGWGSPADHPFNGAPGDSLGYWGRLQVQQDLSAVTAACMVTRRSLYEELNGLDEESFAVCFNDVDYCLRVREKGFLVVWTPYAMLLHETSASLRGSIEDKGTKEKVERFAREKVNMYARWMPTIAFDPAYNRNLTSAVLGFTIENEGAPTWNPDFRPRPRVLVHPADREGCGEYRMIAPSRALLRAGMLHTYETMRLMSPPEMARMEPDAIVLQRQLEFPQIDSIRAVKQFSKAFRVFELDDLITNLPLKSAYRPAISDDIGQRLQQVLALCDRLVVSTEPLARRYGKLCDQVMVVPNRLEGARWDGLEAGRRSGKPRVGWAGAVGHAGDLSLVTSVLEATHRQVDWVFFGMCPSALMPYVAEYHDWVSLDEYPKKLASLDLDLAIAPLEFNPFNEAKSNLRLLEYGVLGYPVICTDILPYQCGLPVTRLKNRHRDWIKTILDMVADRDACHREGQKLREAILAGWMMEDHLDEWQAAWLP